MNPSEYATALEAINAVHSRLALVSALPWVAGLTAWLLWFYDVPALWQIALAVGLVPLTLAVMIHDRERCRLQLIVTMDDQVRRRFEDLKLGFQRMAEAKATWHIGDYVSLLTSDVSAFMKPGVGRRQLALRLGRPPRLILDFDVPLLRAGRQTLYFLPVGLFVFERMVGVVPYAKLRSSVERIQVLEVKRVPEDARVISQTWVHTRKDGGADRRFRHNPEIPIVEYGELRLRSDSGLRERFLCSRPLAMEQFAGALEVMRGIEAGTKAGESS